MAVTTTNLIQGPASIYTGLVGATEPLDSAINTAPATGWTDIGGTEGGVELTINEDTKALDVDQILDTVTDTITARTITFGTNMAEATLLNLARSMNLADTAVTTGTSPVGPTLEPASDLTSFAVVYRAFIIDGLAPGGFRRRIILRKTLQTSNPKMAYKKDGQTLLPVEFATRYVSASIKPFRVVDGIV